MIRYLLVATYTVSPFTSMPRAVKPAGFVRRRLYGNAHGLCRLDTYTVVPAPSVQTTCPESVMRMKRGVSGWRASSIVVSAEYPASPTGIVTPASASAGGTNATILHTGASDSTSAASWG